MSRRTYLKIRLLFLSVFFVLITLFMLNLINTNNSSKTENVNRSFVDIKNINTKLLTYNLEIKEGNSDQIEVKIINKQLINKVKNPIIVNEKENTLEIKQEKTYFNIYSNGLVIIEVPKDQILQYNLSNISGSIDHRVKSEGILKADTVSGSIKMHSVGDSVLAKSVSGSINIFKAFKEVSAKSVSSSVNVLADETAKQINLSSTSGTIKIQLENIPKYNMKYSTISGSVKDNYNDKSLPKSGVIFDSDNNLNIDVSTISGSIILKNWK